MEDTDQEFMQALSKFGASDDATAATEFGSGPSRDAAGSGGTGAAGSCGATARPGEGGGRLVQRQESNGKGDSVMNDDREFMEALQAFESGGQADDASASVSGDFQSMGGGGAGAEGAQAMAGGEDQEFFQALAAFGGGGGGAAGAVAAAGTPEALSLADVCRTYRSVRPIISGVLGFIGAIPGIGGPAVAAVRALMRVLDAVCSNQGTLGQLCQTWRQVKPIVVRIIAFIRRIPVIGGRAANALQALVNVLNRLCP